MSKCKACGESYYKGDTGMKQVPICGRCYSETSVCETCGAVMPKYSKTSVLELRHTCSQKCHNTRVARMPHIRKISSKTAKATYERQKNKPEYMEWLVNKATHLSEFHKDDFSERAGKWLLDGRTSPDGSKKWKESQDRAWTQSRRNKISTALKKIHQDPALHAEIVKRASDGNRTPQARANHSTAAKKAYSEGKYDKHWRDPRILKKTGLERAVELVLYLCNAPYVCNFPVWRYRIDFAIQDVMIGVEADGAHWHDNRKEIDAKRDAYLASRGWTIIRLSEKEIKDDVVDALSKKVVPVIESAFEKLYAGQ